jgi:hypothetical protein
MHDLSLHKFVGPTGARTEINTSPGSAIFFGSEHHFWGDGYKSPNSALP